MTPVIIADRNIEMAAGPTGKSANAGRRGRTRAHILETAARALRERGVDGIGVAALMAQAGLTVGGFYNHFRSRDELVAHSVDRMFEDSARLRLRHLGWQDPRTGVATLVDDYLSEARLGKAGTSCPMPSLSGEANRMPAVARERFRAGVTDFRAALESALADMGLRDPSDAAASILAEMIGAMALARAATSEDGGAILLASRRQIKNRLGLAPAQAEALDPEGDFR